MKNRIEHILKLVFRIMCTRIDRHRVKCVAGCMCGVCECYNITSFPCRYRQKAGFAGLWEPATLAQAGFGDAYTPANETADGTT